MSVPTLHPFWALLYPIALASWTSCKTEVSSLIAVSSSCCSSLSCKGGCSSDLMLKRSSCFRLLLLVSMFLHTFLLRERHSWNVDDVFDLYKVAFKPMPEAAVLAYEAFVTG